MEDYAECHKSHRDIGGKTDGCQEFMQIGWWDPKCLICGCHRNFHRKVVKYKTEVVYTKCHKIHDFKFQSCVDGCQEFTPTSEQGAGTDAKTCANCGCKKSFHRNEITKEVTC
ncbi:hypothetical protein CDL12_02836 [Handroanthus impetiginosus]|uniref:ZF-HD dimerization-type domain-containing protein n=1 Tax=Handroanthus impetiginosus TaxID=429701 RepID=A0A2G9I3V2_9LAMI|nr:hypothetical protein CDL12_02836 [Handroanthus impetiginosus]